MINWKLINVLLLIVCTLFTKSCVGQRTQGNIATNTTGSKTEYFKINLTDKTLHINKYDTPTKPKTIRNGILIDINSYKFIRLFEEVNISKSYYIQLDNIINHGGTYVFRYIVDGQAKIFRFKLIN